MDQEAEHAVKDAVKKGTPFYAVDVDRIGEQVFATCTSRFTNGKPLQNTDRPSATLRAQDALTALMHADYENKMAARRKQTELDAPKLKAESEAASRHYGDCLFGNARILALNSTESAEVVAQAAFASCRDERSLIADVHRRYRDSWFSDEVLDVADKKILGSLILEIIKVRATPPPKSPPSPPPVHQPAPAI
jgi:hypothetical protein